jgi:GDP/UDP-N,N'-diacetylbacillosamine 2-epimerase (hydrolysing)
MKKVCVITGYRSDYTKLKSVLAEIKQSSSLELQVVAFGAHLSNDSGNSIHKILQDGYKVDYKCSANIEGDSPFSMSKSIGLSIIELTSAMETLDPDIVLLVGDRYEILGAAVCASVANIPIAHIQGGELSGTIDETIRHAITKLSHIHFPSTNQSREIILQLGEDPDFVHNVGCPAVDHILATMYVDKQEIRQLPDLDLLDIDLRKPYLIVAQHPVTTRYHEAAKEMRITLEALQEVNIQTVLIYPNPDAGSEMMVREVRKHNQKHKKNNVIKNCYKNISFDSYLNLLKHSSCLVGNSSSGIREAHLFGTPVINIGSRQDNRERTSNIIDVPHEKDDIVDSIMKQIQIGEYKNISNFYGDGSAAHKIVEKLCRLPLENISQKKLWIKDEKR